MMHWACHMTSCHMTCACTLYLLWCVLTLIYTHWCALNPYSHAVNWVSCDQCFYLCWRGAQEETHWPTWQNRVTLANDGCLCPLFLSNTCIFLPLCFSLSLLEVTIPPAMVSQRRGSLMEWELRFVPSWFISPTPRSAQTLRWWTSWYRAPLLSGSLQNYPTLGNI